ncbi:MAG: hypothetical protein R3E97_20725 [Candidatus Eisenbacteria bacterium]
MRLAILAGLAAVAVLGPRESAASSIGEAHASESSTPEEVQSFLLETLEQVQRQEWDTAVPRLRAATDVAQGDWIPEVYAGLAYAALAADHPDSAWFQVETGRQRYIEWLTGFAPEPADRPIISLDSLELLLSGAHATLLAYGDSHRLAPLCFVVHPAGTHVFAIESEAARGAIAAHRATSVRSRETSPATSDSDLPDASSSSNPHPSAPSNAASAPVDELAPSSLVDEAPPSLVDELAPSSLVDELAPSSLVDEAPSSLLDELAPSALVDELIRVPWSRVPDSTERLFLQPPLALLDLPYEDGAVPEGGGESGETLASRYGVSFLPWSSMLSWSAAPRTRSGDGLVILGTLEGDDAAQILGGSPRNAPAPATQADWEAQAKEADVLHVWKAGDSDSADDMSRSVPAETRGDAPGTTRSDRQWGNRWIAGLKLDDTSLGLTDLAAIELNADAVLVDPGRMFGDPNRCAIALLAAGARSALILDSELSDADVQSVERELYLALRSGLPRDRAAQRVRSLVEAGDTPSRASGRMVSGHMVSAHMPSVRVWGPGHLPVYSLMAKRGLGALLLSWVLFLTTGFFVLRFFVRRYVRTDGTDPS